MSTFKYYKNGQWNEVGGNIAGDTLPIGAIVPYGSSTAPTNWLVCDGSAVSRTTYSELFAIIGTGFGEGDGSTTFNLPNLKGRVAVGQDTNDSDFNSIGETGGSKELQKHTHSTSFSNEWLESGGTQVANVNGSGSGNAQTSETGTGNSGNLQPYQVVCYIIKAKQSAGLVGSVLNAQSDSTTDTYSCDFINGKELFDGTEAGEVTLSESTTNYRYIEVIYTGADGDYGSTGKIPVIQNNKIAIITHSFRDNEATLCMWLSTLLINGNKLTPQTSKWAYTNTNGTIGFGAGNYVNVKKVIGYK